MQKFGDFEIKTINFGMFRLDGGAMFGSVPKNLWAKRIEPDEENCIPLATRSMVIKHGSRIFLTDVGMGEKWGEKPRQIFGIKNTPRDQLGFDLSKITDVVLTHLHFDHAGGITRYKDGSTTAVELSFPQAKVHLQKVNWENAQKPNLRERASYLTENVLPLEKANLSLLPDSHEIYPGITVHRVDGHTVGQQWIEVRAGNETFMYPTDLIPTSHHLPVPFTMGYDISALQVMNEKQAFLKTALEKNAIIVFQHDPKVPAARIKLDEKGHYAVKEVVSL